MTVSLLLRVGGNYVATATHKESGQEVKVGPQGNSTKAPESWVHFAHGTFPRDITIDERPATQEEIDAANESTTGV